MGFEFKDDAEFDDFVELLTVAFQAVLTISISGATAFGSIHKAVLFADLLGRAHAYKSEKAKELALTSQPPMREELDEAVRRVWPKLKESLDKDLGFAAVAIRKAKGETTN